MKNLDPSKCGYGVAKTNIALIHAILILRDCLW